MSAGYGNQLEQTDPAYIGLRLPIVMNPPDSLCFLVRVPNDQGHLAAFFGAIHDLSNWTSWQRDALHQGKDAAAVWRDIYTSLVPQICNPPVITGSEVDLGSPLRIDCNCNVFVTCCDGTEKQILTSTQVQALIQGSAVNGAPQPTPGGGCQIYNLTINGGQLQIVPTTVSTGDTIQLTAATGASTQDGVGWQCTDGEIYFAGSCVGGGVTNGGAYVPTAKIGKPVLYLNGVYHDLTIGVPYTIPAGISNITPMLVLNYVSSNPISGQVECTVQVCNNQAGTWTKVLDFTTSQQGFNQYPNGDDHTASCVWTPGQGWQSLFNHSGNQANYLDIEIHGLPSRQWLSAVAQWTDAVNIQESAVYAWDGTTAVLKIAALLPQTAGTNVISSGLASIAYTSTGIRIIFNENVSHANHTITLSKLTLSGPGPSPFGP